MDVLTRVTSQRIALEGGCNFRDLGGYEGANGCKVKYGHLYRSGVMAYFTESDQNHLQTLGIKTICDLRRSDEREKEPTLWPEPHSVAMLTWDDEPNLNRQGKPDWGAEKSPEEVVQTMTTFYRAMPVWLARRLRGVFAQLVTGATPLLFHCSAGKDRTGMTAALILSCLGVSRDAVIADYELTNHAVDLEAFILKHSKAGMGLTDDQHPMMQMPDDIRRSMLNANVDFMAAAFNQIDADYGSVAAMLEQHLGVSAHQQEGLRCTLLEGYA